MDYVVIIIFILLFSFCLYCCFDLSSEISHFMNDKFYKKKIYSFNCRMIFM